MSVEIDFAFRIDLNLKFEFVTFYFKSDFYTHVYCI